MKTTLSRIAALILGLTLLAAALAAPAGAFAANKPTYPTPYPWSKVAGGTTGDFFADEYNGVSSGHVFENATTDRLLDILSTNGTFYIALTGPEHASGQKALALINSQAKAAGITKIYTWDPYLDGYQLNSVDASGWGTLQGGTSVNTSGTANVNEPWRLITSLLPSSTLQPGGALANYDGRGTVLLSVKITDRKNVQTGKQVLASWSLEDTAAAAFDPTSQPAKDAVQAVFYPNGVLQPNSIRSEYDFFKRVYGASATAVETSLGSTQTADRFGHAVDIFSDTDFPNGQGFVLRSVDIKEFFDLANSPGEKVFLFAGNGCHNTQAIIGSVAKTAKLLGTPVVYVVDFSLSSNVHFLTGDNIDYADKATATGGLWIRNSAASSLTSASPYPRYGYSYLYGALASYFDPGWQTENFSKRNNSISYYPNGDFGSTETSGGPWLAGTNLNAKRLQVPTLIRYDKDAAQPVIKHWLHRDSTSTDTTTTYTEYMLELSWARETSQAVAATSTYVDGLTKVQFAREAIAALDPVLDPKSVAYATVTLGTPSYTYNGAAHEPTVTVTLGERVLTQGVDYTVGYSSNTKAGQGTVLITGASGFGGTKSVHFTIAPKSIGGATVVAGPQTYTGSALTPGVSVTLDGKVLSAGTDYTLSFGNNVGVGVATVTVTGTGDYTGTQGGTFAINPKAAAIKSLTSGKKKLTVAWNAVSATTRYEISYRVKGTSAWKATTVVGTRTSLALAGLKTGKTYQVRVRDYQTVGGVKYYSAYSATKTSKKIK